MNARRPIVGGLLAFGATLSRATVVPPPSDFYADI